MKKTFQINSLLKVEFTPCTAIDETGERKPAIFAHRLFQFADCSMFDEICNSVAFGVEMPQSVEEAENVLDVEDDDPEVLSTVKYNFEVL